MPPERWRQIEQIYHSAAGRAPVERDAYLAGACGGDEELRRSVELLLAQDEATGVLDNPLTAATETIAQTGDGESRPGAIVGQYRLLRLLGEGGMGMVYHAHQLRPIRRDVALKIIKPGMDSRQIIARFETERQALALMDHPHIARVFDAGTTPAGRPYFAMELVDGIPITRYCDTRRLNVEERIRLFIPVCQAIQHAHQKGIIHRDIKPSNVLVGEREGQAVPKVIDFGLAKALGQQLSDTTLMTNLGTVVGTLEYMSPEQAEVARHDIDTRSDVYSLGVLLYELLTGETPLGHARAASAPYLEVLRWIREEEAAAASVKLRASARAADTAEQRGSDAGRLPRLIAGELDWITGKALEKDRSRRYETVNGLLRDLERYLEGEAVEAGPVSATYRMRKFMRKYRIWLGTAAAFAFLLVAGAVVSAALAVRANRAETQERAAEQEARAVNDFLRNDLLAQANPRNQLNTRHQDPELTVRTALDRAAAAIGARFEKQPLVEAAIQQTIAFAYNEMGLYPQAQPHAERALELRRRLLGEGHPDTLETEAGLANLYWVEGKYPEAEAIQVKVLEGRRRLLGPEHVDTLSAMNELALYYAALGKYGQAEQLYRQTIDLKRRVLGAEHPNTLASMNNLARLYDDEARFAEAEQLLTNTVAIKTRIMGEEHPSTLTSMDNLALVYEHEGKYAQAEPLYLQVVERGSRVQGEEHPNTLSALHNLAFLYWREGKYAQAEPLYAKTLAGQGRVLGEEHPTTLSNMNDFAILYQSEGKYPEAEALMRKAVDRWKKIEANGSRWRLYECQSLLGASLAGQKRYAEAEPLLIAGHQGLLQVQATIPFRNRLSVQKSGDWLDGLYRDWGKGVKGSR